MRECGACDVCCTVAAVDELSKPARAPCPHSSSGNGCTLYGSADRPGICNSFKCSWLWGSGTEQDRPDKIGLMLSINKVNGGHVVFAMEARPGGVEDGHDMLVSVAREIDLPIILVRHDAPPPHDDGDGVVVRDDLASRASSFLGDEVDRLADDVGRYELVI